MSVIGDISNEFFVFINEGHDTTRSDLAIAVDQ